MKCQNHTRSVHRVCSFNVKVAFIICSNLKYQTKFVISCFSKRSCDNNFYHCNSFSLETQPSRVQKQFFEKISRVTSNLELKGLSFGETIFYMISHKMVSFTLLLVHSIVSNYFLHASIIVIEK